MNHRIATNMIGSYCLKIVKRVVSHIIFISYSRMPAYKHVHNHVANRMFNEQRDSDCACPLVPDASFQFVNIQDLGMRWRRAFWACSVKLMWLTTRLTIFGKTPVVFVAAQLLIICTRKYCVDGSMCHFKFPKVVLTHILGDPSTWPVVASCPRVWCWQIIIWRNTYIGVVTMCQHARQMDRVSRKSLGFLARIQQKTSHNGTRSVRTTRLLLMRMVNKKSAHLTIAERCTSTN